MEGDLLISSLFNIQKFRRLNHVGLEVSIEILWSNQSKLPFGHNGSKQSLMKTFHTIKNVYLSLSCTTILF